ncbi:MAG: hypothetical protein GY798_16160 [Hyphomicrobiales bacterium]|nr:hypothetical protein [Hyphomicrobiales bacterium]
MLRGQEGPTMVTTPTIWKPAFPGNSIDFGDQRFPVATDIGDGRFAIMWVRNSGTLEGQIFDAEGNRIGFEFGTERYGSDLESDVSIAGLPGGGFLVAYTSIGPGGGNGQGSEIIVDTLNKKGQKIASTVIQADDNADDNIERVRDPSIAVQDNGAYLVSYLRKNDTTGAFEVFGRKVSANGTVGAETQFVISNDLAANPIDSDTLSNGTYVVVYLNQFDVADNDVEFRIVGKNGSVAGGDVIANDGTDETDVKVAGLANGGFTAVWQTDDDGDGSGIKFSVFGNAGAVVKADAVNGGFTANTTTGGEQIKPDVTALADGGFLVTWSDVARDAAYGQRFDAAGNTVGLEFKVFDLDDPLHNGIATLRDGRVVVAVGDDGDDNVSAAIVDPRDDVIKGTNDDDVLTSRKDGATVKAKKGNDTLLGQKKKDTLDGGKGKDTLLGREGKDKLTGGRDKDEFVFDTKLNAKKNVDTITDFEINKDKILLDKTIFDGIGRSLSKKEFEIGKKADDKKDRVIYDDKKGKLYHDANGDKSGGKTQFAKLDKKLKLDHNDFDMIG